MAANADDAGKARNQRFVRCVVRFLDNALPAGEQVDWIDCQVTFGRPVDPPAPPSDLTLRA